MNRITISTLGVAACLLSLLRVGETRTAFGTFALEQMERVFDVVENVFHPV
jgi:hypothetical protein